MRKLLAGVAIGVGAAALVSAGGLAGMARDGRAQDLRLADADAGDIRIARGQPLVHPDIVLVEITDASIRDLSEFVGRWPWPRALSGA